MQTLSREEDLSSACTPVTHAGRSSSHRISPRHQLEKHSSGCCPCDPMASPVALLKASLSHTPPTHMASALVNVASCPDGLQKKEGVSCSPRKYCSVLVTSAHSPGVRVKPGTNGDKGRAASKLGAAPFQGPPRLGSLTTYTSSNFKKASFLFHVAKAPSRPISRP